MIDKPTVTSYKQGVTKKVKKVIVSNINNSVYVDWAISLFWQSIRLVCFRLICGAGNKIQKRASPTNCQNCLFWQSIRLVCFQLICGACNKYRSVLVRPIARTDWLAHILLKLLQYLVVYYNNQDILCAWSGPKPTWWTNCIDIRVYPIIYLNNYDVKYWEKQLVVRGSVASSILFSLIKAQVFDLGSTWLHLSANHLTVLIDSCWVFIYICLINESPQSVANNLCRLCLNFALLDSSAGWWAITDGKCCSFQLSVHCLINSDKIGAIVCDPMLHPRRPMLDQYIGLFEYWGRGRCKLMV